MCSCLVTTPHSVREPARSVSKAARSRRSPASYGVADEQVRLSVNCFLGNGKTLAEIEAWWLDRLELPAACLRKATVNRPSSASKAVRKPLVHGTARLAVASTRVVQSIYGAFQEYAGIERPEWA
jgi:hypothetical protein